MPSLVFPHKVTATTRDTKIEKHSDLYSLVVNESKKIRNAIKQSEQKILGYSQLELPFLSSKFFNISGGNVVDTRVKGLKTIYVNQTYSINMTGLYTQLQNSVNNLYSYRIVPVRSAETLLSTPIIGTITTGNSYTYNSLMSQEPYIEFTPNSNSTNSNFIFALCNCYDSTGKILSRFYLNTTVMYHVEQMP